MDCVNPWCHIVNMAIIPLVPQVGLPMDYCIKLFIYPRYLEITIGTGRCWNHWVMALLLNI